MEANGEPKHEEATTPKSQDYFQQRSTSEDLPEWLPDGWIMGIRRRKDGTNDKYYMSPISGRTFRSGAAVMHYLNFGKDGCLAPQEASYFDKDSHASLNEDCDSSIHQITWFEDNNGIMDQHGLQIEDSALAIQSQSNGYNIVSKYSCKPDAETLLGWLPEGWFIELRIRQNERKGKRKYKCYFDPITRYRFYSKEDVLHYLNTGEACNYTYEWEMDEFDTVLSEIEYTPKGLPTGWIKESKIRSNASGIRKDPYYSDPLSGYVFRTKKDAVRFLETGNLSKHAFQPRGGKIISKLSTTREATPPTIARSVAVQPPENEPEKCLLAPQLPSSVDKMVDGDASIENFKHLLPPCEVASLASTTMALTNHQEANTVPAESSNSQVLAAGNAGEFADLAMSTSMLTNFQEENIVQAENSYSLCAEVKRVNSHSNSPKISLNEVDVSHKQSVETTCPANDKLSESTEQKQSTANDFLFHANGTPGINVPPLRTMAAKMNLRPEKIWSLKAAARKLPKLLKAETSSNQHPYKLPLQEIVTEQSTGEKQFATDEKLSKAPNYNTLESKHVQFPRLNGKSSNISNQWEFLATTANNLANPMPFRLPLAGQPRMCKKMAPRKSVYKTMVVGGNMGTVSNASSTTVLADLVSHVTSELSSPLEQANALPTHEGQIASKHSVEKASLCELPVGAAENKNQSKPLTEILHQPVKSVEIFFGSVSNIRNESTEITSYRPLKILHECADMGSHEAVTVKLPSPTMEGDIYSDDKTHRIPHSSSVKIESDPIEAPPLNLVVMIAPPTNAASEQPFPDLGNENLLEPTRKDFPPSLGLEVILPADEICHKESELIKKQENNPENGNMLLSVEPQTPEEFETNEENLSVSTTEGHIPSNILPSKGMETPSDLPTSAVRTFPSDILPELATESTEGQEEEKSPPTRQNNVHLVEDGPLDFANEKENTPFTPTVPESKSKNTCELVNEMTQKVASDVASSHPEALHSLPIDMLPEMPSSSNKNQSNLQRQKSSEGCHSPKPLDVKPRKLRLTCPLDEANIIQVPRRIRSPLTRSKSRVPRRTSSRLAGSQPVKPIITYKRKRPRTN